MAVVLEKTLKRELSIAERPYMLTIDPAGLSLVVKGRRKGIELAWGDLVSGQAALAVALNASLERLHIGEPAPRPREVEADRKPQARNAARVPAKRAATPASRKTAARTPTRGRRRTR
jgi:hypothetical protein